jgi:anthranilate/para-aminobenzoate synthase component I
MTWISRSGPDITPLQALARVANAKEIACLIGERGAALVWYHESAPLPTEPGLTPERLLRGLGRMGDGIARMRQVPVTPPEDSWGQTWGTVPAESVFIQLDYEFPQLMPRVVFAQHVARWDADGRCTLHGIDAGILDAMAAELDRSAPPPVPIALAGALSPDWDGDGHGERIGRIRDWIAAGDCYQANLAVPFRAQLKPGRHRDLAAFLQLMAASPAPFAGFFRTPGRPSVISHSPECFLAQRNRALVSVPIKGTRRREAGHEAAVRAELASAPKDAAELAMIVDLVRNDLGRVAVPGSVRVTDAGHLIDLPYVHHRAARVEAKLRDGLTLADAVLAAFPAGSITGAPKLRAMQILRELEGTARGAYCGAFGWIGAHGGDLAVAIRTASIDGDTLTFHAGGGIVWDSDPAAEWDEVQAKVSGFARAMGAM